MRCDKTKAVVSLYFIVFFCFKIADVRAL